MNKDSERQSRYDSKSTVRVGLKLNRQTDEDILRRLDEVDSMQGYIKYLIRKDLASLESVPEKKETIRIPLIEEPDEELTSQLQRLEQILDRIGVDFRLQRSRASSEEGPDSAASIIECIYDGEKVRRELSGISFNANTHRIQVRDVLEAVRNNEGDIKAAAEDLGISWRTLYRITIDLRRKGRDWWKAELQDGDNSD